MLRVRTTFLGATGAPWLSTAYFLGTDLQADATAANAIIGAYWGTIDNVMGSGITWTTEDSVAVLTQAGEQTGAWGVTPITGAGSVATDLLPMATQGLVRWRTGVFIGGREVRGRTFIPGLTELAATNGNMTAATGTTITGAGSALIADAATIFAVWSPTHATATAVTTNSVWSQFAVLRSRRD